MVYINGGNCVENLLRQQTSQRPIVPRPIKVLRHVQGRKDSNIVYILLLYIIIYYYILYYFNIQFPLFSVLHVLNHLNGTWDDGTLGRFCIWANKKR